MAKLNSAVRLKVGPNSTSTSYGAGTNGLANIQLDFARIWTQDNFGTCFFHMKTNIAVKSDIMIMIEAEGYNYGQSQPIRCAWTHYLYNAPNIVDIYNPAQHNTAYTGLTAERQYASVDGFLVIVGTALTSYYCGFNLTAYLLNPANTNNSGQTISITNYAVVNTTGAQY